MPSGKSRRTHSKGKKTALHKAGVRKKFSARHIDQVTWFESSTVLYKLGVACMHGCMLCTLPTRPVCLQVWEDVRKEEGVHNGKTGPVGTLQK